MTHIKQSLSGIIAICLITLLSACSSWNQPNDSILGGPSNLTAFSVVEGATIINSDKTIGDHISSWMSGKDCSSIREKMFNTDYCQAYPTRPPKKPPVFCYKSIANVTCYSEPSTNPNDILVGSTH